MKKENKKLLIKDLCSRLPYGLIIDYNGIRTTLHDMKVFHLYNGSDDIKDYICLINVFGDDDYVDVENIKPYLFPLSSMIEEQKKEYNRLKHNIQLVNEWGCVVENGESFDSPESFEYLIENKFDCFGLIPKGLALDATNQNVY